MWGCGGRGGGCCGWCWLQERCWRQGRRRRLRDRRAARIFRAGRRCTRCRRRQPSQIFWLHQRTQEENSVKIDRKAVTLKKKDAFPGDSRVKRKAVQRSRTTELEKCTD